MDLKSFIADPNFVAMRVAASDLFGVLTRRVELPTDCAAIVWRDGGAIDVAPEGSEIDGRAVREVVFVRTTPMNFEFAESDLESADGHACEAVVRIALSVVPERADLESFTRSILGGSRRANLNRIALHIRDTVSRAMHDFAGRTSAEALVKSSADEEFADAIAKTLKPVLFAAGIGMSRHVTLTVSSAAWERARRGERDAEARAKRQEAERARREADIARRETHVRHLSELMGQLDDLAAKQPNVSVAELIRTFDAGQRGALYQQLLAREVSAERTAAIAVVAGSECLLYDPTSDAPMHRRAFDGPLGALRSVRLIDNDPARGLLIGAQRGVYHYQPDSGQLDEYAFDAPDRLRGGVNAAVVVDNMLYATHSEVGVMSWALESLQPGRTVLDEITAGARSVRDIQADEFGTLWFTAGDRVIGWSPRDALPASSAAIPGAGGGGHGGPGSGVGVSSGGGAAGSSGEDGGAAGAGSGGMMPTGTLVSMGSIAGSGGAPRVAALCVADGGVYAGTNDGRLLSWPCDAPNQISTILSGEAGRVESVQWVRGAGVERLLVASKRPSVWMLVVGDAWRGEYRCGEPVRWAAAADDWIIAVNDRRDRVHSWRPSRPDAIAHTIYVSRLVGHSIQDAALVPMT
jgi:hypothetical protein